MEQVAVDARADRHRASGLRAGYEAIIGPSLSEILRAISFTNGLLAAILPESQVAFLSPGAPHARGHRAADSARDFSLVDEIR